MIGGTDKVKNRLYLLGIMIVLVFSLSGCGGIVEKKVTCTMCNGSGQVNIIMEKVTMIIIWDPVQVVMRKDIQS